MRLSGSIVDLKSRVNASGDVIQTVKLEVHGEFSALHALERKPLAITLEAEKTGPFE